MTANDTRLDEIIQKIQSGNMRLSEADGIKIAARLYAAKRYGQAVNVCSQMIKHKPTLSDAHSIQGVSLTALGKKEEGIAALRRAIKLNAGIASYHSNLGELLRQTGDLAGADEALQNAIKLDRKNAEAHNNLGIVFFEKREFTAAVESYKEALKLRPSFPEALNNFGNALRKLGDIDAAGKAYQDALGLREVYPEVYNNLGTLLREQHKPQQAEHALKKAIQQNPRYVEAFNNLAAIHHAENNDVAALGQLSEALKIEPANARSLLLTARIQTRRGTYAAAERACQLVLEKDPDNSEALTVLGTVKHEMDCYEEALELHARAVDLRPDSPEARNYYGIALKSVGKLDEARDQLLKALELNGSMYGAYSNLNDLIDFSKDTDLFDRMSAIFESVEDDRAESLLPLHFAYAKALDDNGQHEKALEHYVIGGEMKRAQLNYVETDTFKFFEDIKKTFSAKFFKDRTFKGISDERPLFIIGMPRSGSTLVEQIVSSHKDIFGAGEIKYFSQALHRLRDRFPALSRYPEMTKELSDSQLNILGEDYIAAIGKDSAGSKRVTDKLLTNYFFIGLLHTLFPKAKFINTRRNPIDTCLSGFTKLFKDDMPHSYDLGELGRYYRQYDALMAHWEKVLPKGVLKVVEYEDVVADTEGKARELIDFVGLDWDEACLEFYKSKRPVKTASVAQVRKPIYKTSVERWKKYGSGLQPLVDAIGS